jgi:hypothetical protein
VQCTTRIPADVHRAAVHKARQKGWSLNDFIVSAIRAAVDNGELPEPVGMRQNVKVYDDNGQLIGTI